MRLRDVGLVYRKELRETLRDRRTLLVMILFPLVVYPLLSILVAQVMASKAQRQEARPSRVVIDGPAGDTAELRAAVRKDTKQFALLDTGDRADVEAGRVDALLDFRKPPAGQTKVEIVYDETRDESRKARERLEDVVGKALPTGCTPRYALGDRNIAGKSKLASYLLSKVLPLVVVLMVLLGAFYPAIDVTAGERERGTLETILSAPIDRFDLMAGKVLAVATLAAVTGALNLGSMSVTLAEGVRLASGREGLGVPWGRAALTTVVILPASFLFASTLVAVGSIARSFKEAQNLLTPVYFLCFTPAIMAALGEYELRGLIALVPGINVTLLAREIILGTVKPAGAVMVLGSTLAYGAGALALAARLYDSERLLYAGDADVPLGTWLRRMIFGSRAAPRREGAADLRAASQRAGAPAASRGPAGREIGSEEGRGPGAGGALALFAIAYVLLYFVWIPAQSKNLVRGLLLSEWLGLAGLVWLYARSTGLGLVRTLRLAPPRPRAIAGALLIGSSSFVVLGLVMEWFFPVSDDVIEELRKLVAPQDGSRSLPFNLFLVALTPAMCEEALFRGPILRGLSSRLQPVAAIALTGLFFGLFHVQIERIVPTALLGILLSWLALTTGSIVPSMLAHFVNNAILTTLAQSGADEALAHVSGPLQAVLFGLALLVLALGVVLARGTARPSP